jgi:hypothetical protein
MHFAHCIRQTEIQIEVWTHKIIKRKNSKYRKSLIIWLIFFLFLQTKPSFSPLIAWFQMDNSVTSDLVSAVCEGYQLNYCWILKLLSGPRNVKILNLCGNQLISTPYLLMSLFLLFLGKIFLQLNFEF